MSIHERLETIFRDVFDDDALEVSDRTTAADIDGWDSVAHVNLMFAVEESFGIRFHDDELGGFADVGELKDALRSKGVAS